MSESSRMEVPVNPDVLVWARESIGYSRERAAELLDMTETNLGMIEEGVRPVSFSRLQKMAEKYDRPLLALMLPEVPPVEDILPDFRKITDRGDHSWSPALHKAYRRVLGQRTIMIDLMTRSRQRLPYFDLTTSPDADSEDIGEFLRNFLMGDTEFEEKNPGVVLKFWSATIESKGVLVTHVSGVAIDEMRGFTIGDRPFPAIALNGADSTKGRIFTLFHEFSHVLLNRSSLCDLEETLPVETLVPQLSSEYIERFCNRVSAAVLMPRAAVLEEPVVAGANKNKSWTDEELEYLADKFVVSEEAIVLRLLMLGKTNWDFYMNRRGVYTARYKNRQKQSGGPSHYVRTVRNLGISYVRSVWNAYQRGDISDPELSRYLQTSIEFVPKLIEEAGLPQ